MSARLLLLAALLALPWQDLDVAVQRASQAGRRPALEAPMHALSADSRPVLLVGMGVALLSGGLARAAAVEALVALVPVNLVVELTKRAVDRARPDGERRRSNAAFPSSHAANAFALAWVLARRWPRGWPAYFLLAAAIGWSRIYLNRHWATDVLVGAALGVALAELALQAWRRWRHPSGAVEAGTRQA